MPLSVKDACVFSNVHGYQIKMGHNAAHPLQEILRFAVAGLDKKGGAASFSGCEGRELQKVADDSRTVCFRTIGDGEFGGFPVVLHGVELYGRQEPCWSPASEHDGSAKIQLIAMIPDCLVRQSATESCPSDVEIQADIERQKQLSNVGIRQLTERQSRSRPNVEID
jgi:hypothetical protein